jgi:hypothetical protein
MPRYFIQQITIETLIPVKLSRALLPSVPFRRQLGDLGAESLSFFIFCL